VEPGPLTEQVNRAKKFAKTFGIDVDENDIANYEQLAPIFGQFLFQGIQQTKGSVSNKEMEIFQKINANYDYTTEGNRRLLTYAKARAERDIKVRSLVRDLRQKGRSPMDISEAVDNYIQGNDLSDTLSSLVAGNDISGLTDEELMNKLEGK
jgi:hypothetical protein